MNKLGNQSISYSIRECLSFSDACDDCVEVSSWTRIDWCQRYCLYMFAGIRF